MSLGLCTVCPYGLCTVYPYGPCTVGSCGYRLSEHSHVEAASAKSNISSCSCWVPGFLVWIFGFQIYGLRIYGSGVKGSGQTPLGGYRI